jgi:hypothetical protein
MSTTVYFATNRVVTNAADAINGYGNDMVPPLKPQEITYGTAVVEGVNVGTGASGIVSQISNVQQGAFSQQAIAALSDPGRDLLVFIHGFDNTFSDAITVLRSTGNGWLLPRSRVQAQPSLRSVGHPVLQKDYLADQSTATNSGLALMSLFANLEPILDAAQRKGSRVTLLAHSMGNLALESAVMNCFSAVMAMP